MNALFFHLMNCRNSERKWWFVWTASLTSLNWSERQCNIYWRQTSPLNLVVHAVFFWIIISLCTLIWTLREPEMSELLTWDNDSYTCKRIQMAEKRLKKLSRSLLLLLLTKYVELNLTVLSWDWPKNLSMTDFSSSLSVRAASFPGGKLYVTQGLFSRQESRQMMFTPPSSLSGREGHACHLFIIENSCFPQTPARHESWLTH